MMTVLAFSGVAPLCFAEDESPPPPSVDPVEQRLLALEQIIEEMQRRHAEEIAALKEEIIALRESESEPAASEEDELAQLRSQAAAEAEKEGEETIEADETTFQAKGLSLQSLNPEFSVTGDMNAFYLDTEETRERSGAEVRSLGLHFESYLDPYTKFKAAVPVNEYGAELGEAYMTRFGLPGRMNITFGKFRQQFGVVNRWHKHALDQFDFPLPLRQVFGNGGLNQTGVSFDWALPQAGKTSQGLTFQLTNGKNPRLFSGNTLGTPSFLLHYKNYHDVSKDTYFEVGLTGLIGWRDEWYVEQGTEIVTVNASQAARVYGADFNLLWEPTDRMRYRNLEWRMEFYILDRDILAPDGSGKDTINAWGAYTYLQSKLNRKLEIGARFDYYEPDTKGYALPGSWLAPQAFSTDVTQWQAVPYVTWLQSPWVRWHIEYNYLDPGDVADSADRIILQLVFAAGPHKHERY